ncbi:MAG: prolyl oligopeptidase family serine peptidase [Armatimonadetes bacterium]|nr:prolyl oligopeptidase family serine peptidase [Armatimonadota bacterium]
MLLAGLYETKAGDPAVSRNSSWERNRRWWYGLHLKLGAKPYRYLLHLPKGYDQGREKRWPAILFLHGAGERGSNLERVKVHGPPKIAPQRDDFPFIVISPQCPENECWLPVQVMDVLDEVCAKHRVDPDRIYLTGLSMGGYGTWSASIEYPDRFAAIAPICGGGDPADAGRIRHLPIWVFHGGKDDVVPIEGSRAMVEALKKLGTEARFTIYPEAGHDSWTESYDNPELYSWFLSHRRGEK